MLREIEIDKAIYLVDTSTKTYRFLRRNPRWRELSPRVNEQNKASIDGFTRIFRDGRTRLYTHPARQPDG